MTVMHSIKGVHRKKEERKLIAQDFALFPPLVFYFATYLKMNILTCCKVLTTDSFKPSLMLF